MAEKLAVVLVDPATGLPYVAIPVTVGAGINRETQGDITSTQSFEVNTAACGTARIEITDTDPMLPWAGTIRFEYTINNGTTWNPLAMDPDGGGGPVSQTTANGEWSTEVSAYGKIRAIGDTVSANSARVYLSASTATSTVVLGMPLPAGNSTIGKVKVTDGTDDLAIDGLGRAAVQNPPNLDAALSSRATEVTLQTVAKETTLSAQLDAKTSTLARESGGNLAASASSLASIDGKFTNPLPVSAASLPLPSGAAKDATLTSGDAFVRLTSDKTNPAVVANSAPSGTEYALVTRNIPSGTQSVSGPLTDAQLRALAVPVSGTLSVSNTFALDATLAKLTVSQGASLGSNTQALVGASVTTAAPAYSTGQISPLSIKTDGSLRTADSQIGIAGSPHAAVFSVQGVSGGTVVPIGQAVASALNATMVGGGASKTVISSATTTQVKSGTGVLYAIVYDATIGLNVVGYDDVGGGTANQFIARSTTVTSGSIEFGPFGVSFSNGLKIVTTGGVSIFVVVIYR